MRLLYPLFFICLLVISAYTWINNFVFSDPKAEAIAFLKDVQTGSLAKSVKHFGGNACRCPAKGGWGSYLIYASGQEPNLAFMTGHPFEIGKPEEAPMKNNKTALLPWEKPQDVAVDVPVTFNQQYAPLFLPLETAYGRTISEADFNQFLENPTDNSAKGFTLRFRPALEPGSIAPPNEPLPPEAATEFQALNKDRKDKSPDQKSTVQGKGDYQPKLEKLLPAEAKAYLLPKDAADVVRPDGTKLSLKEIASRLPRLKSAILRLHVVRRGQLKDWTVYHFGFMDPILQEGSRTITIPREKLEEEMRKTL